MLHTCSTWREAAITGLYVMALLWRGKFWAAEQTWRVFLLRVRPLVCHGTEGHEATADIEFSTKR